MHKVKNCICFDCFCSNLESMYRYLVILLINELFHTDPVISTSTAPVSILSPSTNTTTPAESISPKKHKTSDHGTLIISLGVGAGVAAIVAFVFLFLYLRYGQSYGGYSSVLFLKHGQEYSISSSKKCYEFCYAVTFPFIY